MGLTTSPSAAAHGADVNQLPHGGNWFTLENKHVLC